MDPRVFPWLEVDLAQVLAGRIESVERAEGGLTHTVHRVRLATGELVGVKTFASSAFAVEAFLLARLHGVIPVPAVLQADAPHLVYRWIEGVTLNDFRKQAPDRLLPLAASIGGVLAVIARQEHVELPRRELDRAALVRRLEQGRARERLGGPLADRLLTRFEALEAPTGDHLVHGDFGGRNILVSNGQLAGILDWEAASLGSLLWDVGSLFRYPDRYDAAFRTDFASAYRNAGGDLPDDWWRKARLLDATRLVGTLDEPRELPTVFADCRELLERIVTATIRPALRGT
jgi:aminoglycoside phosphotransferase (APT) family kinase protein